MRQPFGAEVVGAVEVSGAVAPGCIAAAGVPVLFVAQPEAAQFGVRWAAAWREDRGAELPCVDRWAVVPLWVLVGAPQYAGRVVLEPPWARPGVPQYADRAAAPPP